MRRIIASSVLVLSVSVAAVSCSSESTSSGVKADTSATDRVPTTDSAGSRATDSSVGTADSTPDSTANRTAAPSGSDSKFCKQVKELAEFNESEQSPNLDGSFEEIKDSIVEAMNEGLPLYDKAADAAPAEVRAELDLLRDLSKKAVEAINKATDEEDLFTKLGELGTPEVLKATQKLDAYLETNCGFGLTTA